MRNGPDSLVVGTVERPGDAGSPAEPPACAPEKRDYTFAKLCALPPFRPAIVKIFQLEVEKESAFEDLVRTFNLDPTLATEVLHVANSPLFGVQSTVQTIRHAVSLLGIEYARSLAVSVAMRWYFAPKTASAGIRDIWRHSVATATIAEHLADRYRIQPGLAYTGGLIHDVGRLGLLKAYREEYGTLLAGVHEDPAQMCTSEVEAVGVDHCTAGGFLIRVWGFPPAQCDLVEGHHRESGRCACDLAGIVEAGCILATALGYGAAQYAHKESVDEVLASLPNTRAAKGETTAAGLKKLVEQRIGIE